MICATRTITVQCVCKVELIIAVATLKFDSVTQQSHYHRMIRAAFTFGSIWKIWWVVQEGREVNWRWKVQERMPTSWGWEKYCKAVNVSVKSK
jgi:hypothetical protein